MLWQPSTGIWTPPHKAMPAAVMAHRRALRPAAAGSSSLSNYDNTILAESSLLAYYPMSDAAGAALVKDRKGTNDGTPGSAVTLASTALTGDGKTCGSFDGSANAYVKTSLWSPGSSFSYEAIVEATNSRGGGSPYSFLIKNGTTNGNGMVMDGLVLRLYNNTSADRVSTFTFSLNTVYHLVITCNGTNTLFYVNGSLHDTISGGADTPSGSSMMGAISSNGTSFTNNWFGLIEKVAIYNAVLTATQVTNHYNARNS